MQNNKKLHFFLQYELKLHILVHIEEEKIKFSSTIQSADADVEVF